MAQEEKIYDHIIIGMGAAGLSLAWRMLQHPTLHPGKVLLIDKSPKTENDRTWSFWAEEPGPFADIIYKTWHSLEFAHESFHAIFHLKKYSYHTIRAIDFYEKIIPALEANEDFDLAYGNVDAVSGLRDGVKVDLDGRSIIGKNVFDSRVPKITKRPDRHFLLQHFKGWFVKAKYAAFDADTARFMDFRTPQGNEVRFFYVLPFSATEALVEYTLFSPGHLADSEYDDALKGYMLEGLGIQADEYEVLEEEFGSIPMTDADFPPSSIHHHHYIGSAAGCTKPSTGYTFANIQRHSELIITALAQGRPVPAYVREARFKFYDSVMLELMEKEGPKVAGIFGKMFKNTDPEQVMKFLDDQTSALEDVSILASVPPGPFIKAALMDRLRRML